MKKLLLSALAVFVIASASAQVLKRLGDRVKNKMENKAADKIDRSIDESLQKDTRKDKSDDSDDNASNESGSSKTSTSKSGATSSKLAYNTKFDFVPGEKVVSYEDFSRADIGDFPTRWNTNSTAEIVTLNNKPGKWLKINKPGYFFPEMITTIPENSTLEFDIGVNEDFSWYNNAMQMWIADLEDREGFQDERNWYLKHNITLELHPNRDANEHTGKFWFRSKKEGNARLSSEGPLQFWGPKKNNFAHFSFWRQNQRLRLYVNGDKVLDVPRAFDADGKYNALIFQINSFHTEGNDYILLGNFRVAVGAPDTRNKLITEGKFVTRGILFDVNSDKIKPESYGALKDIGNVLKENPSVKVKIVGHTDSDGDEKSNMDLSARRAAAVKDYLVKEFGISEDNLQSEGKGESQPVDKNDSQEGKANNRRVEFIKL